MSDEQMQSVCPWAAQCETEASRIAALEADLTQAVQMYTDAAGERDKAIADLAAAQAERDGLKQSLNRFHHIMHEAGLHPGRTDDDLLEILEKHLAEAAVAAEQRRAERSERTIRADERQRVWGDLMRRFSDRDRRRIAGNFAHDYTVSAMTMEARFRADLVETFTATIPKAEAIKQLDAEKEAARGADHDSVVIAVGRK